MTAFSRHVKDGLRKIDGRVHGISLLGGWAVYELVQPGHAMESQDIDILVHHQTAWNDAIPFLEKNGYSWRWITNADGQQRDHCLEHEYHEAMVADVFYADKIGDEFVRKLFSTGWMTGFKSHPYDGFVPSVETTLFDKFETLASASGVTGNLYHRREGRSREKWTGGIGSRCPSKQPRTRPRSVHAFVRSS